MKIMRIFRVNKRLTLDLKSLRLKGSMKHSLERLLTVLDQYLSEWNFLLSSGIRNELG